MLIITTIIVMFELPQIRKLVLIFSKFRGKSPSGCMFTRDLSIQVCESWPRPHIIGLWMPWTESTNSGTRLETDQVMLTAP